MPKAPEPSSTCQKTTKSLPRISPKSYCYNAVPNRFSSRFSTSRTNGPRSLSRVKAGTHSAFGEGSHTAAHTAKQGAFRMEVVSLPSARSACCRNAGRPLVKTTHLPFSWSGYFFVDFSGINYAPIRNLENLKTILIFSIACGMVVLLEIKPLHRSYYVGKL